MRLTDTEKYFNYVRMSSENFNKLLQMVELGLTKMYCVREPISPAKRLTVTLRYLASGDSMVSTSYAFRIGKTTVSHIIRDTCSAIWNCLKDIVFIKPSPESWKNIAEEYNQLWNLPNCVGSIDGKHVAIQAPPRSGSKFYNYKYFHSIVLLALCDAQYKFTFVDIGAEGRQSDRGIFSNSLIGRLLVNQENLYLPEPAPIDVEGEPINHYIAADGAFPLTTNIMRLYAENYLPLTKRMFNYRLSRGRRVIENSFGILTARWRIYRKPIIAKVSTVEEIIKATVCLHNWLLMLESEIKTDNQKMYCRKSFVDQETSDGELIPGEWRAQIEETSASNRRFGSNMYSQEAEIMRSTFSLRRSTSFPME